LLASCTRGLKHQKEKRSMDHFGGLDVSVKETSICIVDDTGRIVKEVKVASAPEALLKVLFKRIGLEAGPLSQWLFSALAEAELPVVCVETRHMQAVLKAQINKTDRNDARGIAQMIRVGLYRPVHVKTLRSQKLRMLLTIASFCSRRPSPSRTICEVLCANSASIYDAAQSMMHSKKWSWLKAWAMQIARRRGMKKAIVAFARRLAMIMHRIWVDGTEFRWTREQVAAAA
jgi:transposase